MFNEFALTLSLIQDIPFIQNMVSTLTLALATEPLYQMLREKLRGLSAGGIKSDSKEKFFWTLYRTWTFNPISTLTLCLISRNYELAYNLIPRFSLISLEISDLLELANLV